MKTLYKKIIVIFGIMTILGAITVALIYNGIIWPVNPSLMGYKVKGIDVARYQGDIDWKVISEQDIRFAFIKATEGSSYSDPMFTKNIVESKENKIATGAYHFFSSESTGKTQAENFITITAPYEMDLPPVLDFEIAPENVGDKDGILTQVKIFLSELENFYGMKPIIYTTYESYNAFLGDGFEDYALWFRDLLREPKIKDKKDWVFWQYCNRGRLNGIDKQQKYTDLNVFNGDIDDFTNYLDMVKAEMQIPTKAEEIE